MTGRREWCRPALRLLAALMAAGLTGAAGPPDAEELVQRCRDAWISVPLRMRATMTATRPGRPETVLDLVIERDGEGRSLIEFVAPEKDRGKLVLTVGEKTWLYLPRADKVTKISRRRNPFAAGVTFEDLLPEEIGSGTASISEAAEAFLLEVRPEGTGRRGHSRIAFDKATLLPVRREFYSSSGKLLRTVHIEETRTWSGRNLPSRIRIVERTRRGTELLLEVHEFAELGDPEDGRFDPEHLASGVRRRSTAGDAEPGRE